MFWVWTFWSRLKMTPAHCDHSTLLRSHQNGFSVRRKVWKILVLKNLYSILLIAKKEILHLCALCINNLLCPNMYVFCPSKVTLLFRPDVSITYLVLKIASLFQDLFKSLAPGFMWEENLLCHEILMKGRNLKYAVVCI